MFKIKLIFILAITALATLTACDDDDDGGSSNATPQSTEINNLILSGNWIVESLIDDGVDETAHYADFVLNFNDQGQVVATSSSNSELSRTGNYLVYTDDGKIELEMNFPNPGIIDDLNDDWYFVSQNGNTLLWDDQDDVLLLTQQ